MSAWRVCWGLYYYARFDTHGYHSFRARLLHAWLDLNNARLKVKSQQSRLSRSRAPGNSMRLKSRFRTITSLLQRNALYNRLNVKIVDRCTDGGTNRQTDWQKFELYCTLLQAGATIMNKVHRVVKWVKVIPGSSVINFCRAQVPFVVCQVSKSYDLWF